MSSWRTRATSGGSLRSGGPLKKPSVSFKAPTGELYVGYAQYGFSPTFEKWIRRLGNPGKDIPAGWKVEIPDSWKGIDGLSEDKVLLLRATEPKGNETIIYFPGGVDLSLIRDIEEQLVPAPEGV